MRSPYHLVLTALLTTSTTGLLAQLPTVDSVFATNGVLISPNSAAQEGSETERILELSDGHYLGIGSRWLNMGFYYDIRPCLMKYDLCGEPDTSFSNDGSAEIPWLSMGYLIPRRAVELADGSMLMFGSTNPAGGAYSGNRPAIFKVLANGQLDLSFGVDGVLSYDFPDVLSCGFGHDLLRLESGKLIGTASRSSNSNGGSQGMALFGYLPDGGPDPDFASGGVLHVGSSERVGVVRVHQVNDTTLLVLTAKLLGGGPDFLQLELSAYDTTGALQTAFGTNGIAMDTTLLSPMGRWGFDSALDDQGRIVVFGRKDEQHLQVMRFLPDGTRDTAFGTAGTTYVPALGANAAAVRLLIRDDGTMVCIAATFNAGSQWFVLDADGDLAPGTNSLMPLPSGRVATDLLSVSNGRWMVQAQGGFPIYDQMQLRMSDAPVVMPHIAANGADLVTTGSGTDFQWYLNGTAIPNATGTSHTPAGNGDYTVEMTDDLGCTALSPVFTVIAASVQGAGTHEVLLVNTMAEDRLMVTNPGDGMNAYRILNMSGQVVATGRLVNGTNTLDVSRLAPGAYVLALEDGDAGSALRWVKM
ncbi:MAG: T9SS type A sorting domain-containing protein [Flavobacteriales bacterium]|nr:T9SS type A sorting domain-containing protein [Flavobacteriales bacterium]